MSPAVPSATIVLLRDGARGLEVLLLRRSARSAFVPGAYVFPGGVLDAADASPRSLALLDGLSVEEADARLGLNGAEPPAAAYYVAAVREAFEETGILVCAGGRPGRRTAAEDEQVARAREALLSETAEFAELLERLGCRVPGDRMAYLAHWITPEGLPRRFDTRFFAARAPADAEPAVDPREMTGALWIAPAAAVAGHAEGRLPMILPTVRTLEELGGHGTVEEALAALRGRVVRTIQPTLGSLPRDRAP